MKALTLWQPWASLIAVGAKTIETRGWATNYRGPLAIHAAKRRPDVEMLEDGLAGELYGVTTGDDSCLAQWYENSEEDYIPERLPEPEDRWSLGLAPEFMPVAMPLGKIVATCRLTDVVPSEKVKDISETLSPAWYGMIPEHPVTEGGRYCIGARHDQFEYGDLGPGRFAWLLSDVVLIAEPIPAKGAQGLWEWKP